MSPDHQWNQTCANVSEQINSGTAMICGDFTMTVWRKYKTLLQLAEMVANVSAFSFALSSLLLSIYPPLPTIFYSSSSTKFFSYSSIPFAEMYFANIFRRFAAAISPSKMVDSVRNGGRSRAFSANQTLCFFDIARFLTAAQRSTLVTGIQILSLAMAKAISVYMETTGCASSDTARMKEVTNYLREFFPTGACANVIWTSPSVAQLVSMARFGKSSHTRLNLSLSGLLVRMRSWIEQIFLSHSLFISWWSINVDKVL